MSPRPPRRATVTTAPILLATPVRRMGARVVNRREDFACEAVVPDAGYGAFDARFIPRMPDARGVDMEIPGLRVLEKRRRDPRRERIRIDDDRLGVIRNEDREHAAEKLPGGFAGLNRPRGRFLERRIHKPVARADRCEDPRAKPSPWAREQGPCEPAHPARSDLQLPPRLALRHGERP